MHLQFSSDNITNVELKKWLKLLLKLSSNENLMVSKEASKDLVYIISITKQHHLMKNYLFFIDILLKINIRY